MINSVKFIMNEYKNNLPLIIKMAFMNTEKQTVRSSLGLVWTYFHDVIYILVFIMFRLLISGTGNIMGMNSIIYLMTGMIPWFLINDVLSQGSMSIRNNKGIVQSIRFPVPILPTIEVLSIFIRRLFSFIMLFAVDIIFGYIKYFHFWLFIYYVICAFILCVTINLLISAIVAISDDFHQFYMAIVRVLIYTMPILWDYSRVHSVLINILLRINPMVYVIKGFRDAYVLGATQNTFYTLYFWGCIAFLFTLGCFVQFKLRKYYADFV